MRHARRMGAMPQRSPIMSATQPTNGPAAPAPHDTLRPKQRIVIRRGIRMQIPI
jgi:hypothetical protein